MFRVSIEERIDPSHGPLLLAQLLAVRRPNPLLEGAPHTHRGRIGLVRPDSPIVDFLQNRSRDPRYLRQLSDRVSVDGEMVFAKESQSMSVSSCFHYVEPRLSAPPSIAVLVWPAACLLCEAHTTTRRCLAIGLRHQTRHLEGAATRAAHCIQQRSKNESGFVKNLPSALSTLTRTKCPPTQILPVLPPSLGCAR